MSRPRARRAAGVIPILGRPDARCGSEGDPTRSSSATPRGRSPAASSRRWSTGMRGRWRPGGSARATASPCSPPSRPRRWRCGTRWPWSAPRASSRRTPDGRSGWCGSSSRSTPGCSSSSPRRHRTRRRPRPGSSRTRRCPSAPSRDWTTWPAEALAEADRPFPGRAQPDDLAVLIASGGTTGTSKASMRSFDAYAALLGDPSEPERKLLTCSAFAYVSQVLIAQTLLGGGSVTLRDRFDPAELLRVVEAERITQLSLVEPLLAEFADHPALPDTDLSSLRRVSHIGAPAPASFRRRLLDPARADPREHLRRQRDRHGERPRATGLQPRPPGAVEHRRPAAPRGRGAHRRDGRRAAVGRVHPESSRCGCPGCRPATSGARATPRSATAGTRPGTWACSTTPATSTCSAGRRTLGWSGTATVLPLDLEDAACAASRRRLRGRAPGRGRGVRGARPARPRLVGRR